MMTDPVKVIDFTCLSKDERIRSISEPSSVFEEGSDESPASLLFFVLSFLAVVLYGGYVIAEKLL